MTDRHQFVVKVNRGTKLFLYLGILSAYLVFEREKKRASSTALVGNTRKQEVVIQSENRECELPKSKAAAPPAGVGHC